MPLKDQNSIVAVRSFSAFPEIREKTIGFGASTAWNSFKNYWAIFMRFQSLDQGKRILVRGTSKLG